MNPLALEFFTQPRRVVVIGEAVDVLAPALVDDAGTHHSQREMPVRAIGRRRNADLEIVKNSDLKRPIAIGVCHWRK
jgi:hypothetical protein